MIVRTGLDRIAGEMPADLKGKKAAILFHAPSITSDFRHIVELFASTKGCYIGALFGPQHGVFGQTQDNMIEWEGALHPVLGVPVYSLYGQHRKPTPVMLKDIEIFIIDLQDVGARLYTYIWTVKLCMEACSEASVPVYILDRPNPIGRIRYDGPVLKKEYFTFVGGAEIPLCHRMTVGEMALWIKEKYIPACDLHIIGMEGWQRGMMYRDTHLPWVLPSPNMPSQESATVYPGTVLAEALNISEGRGTVIPFELIGAPFVNPDSLLKELRNRKVPGCMFRIHDYIPTFHKFVNELCHGIQIHVTDYNTFRPVVTALHLFDAIIRTSKPEALRFNPPPYEYEYNLMPFDILSGDSRMREVLQNGYSIEDEVARWDNEIAVFTREFGEVSLYNE